MAGTGTQKPTRDAHRRRRNLQRKLDELKKVKNGTEQHQQFVQNIEQMLNQNDEEIKKISDEDWKAMDIDMDDDEIVDDGGLQPPSVPGQDRDLARPSVEFATDVKQADEDEHGPPLFAPPKVEDIPGSDTVACQLGRLARTYINRYGPKNAGCYRIEPIALNPAYETMLEADHTMRVVHNTCNPQNSAGSQRNPDGTRTYGTRHLLYIVAVAWGVKGAGVPREEDLELLRPGKDKKWRDVPTKVLVAWQLDKDKIMKCWETRSIIRDRWRKANADEAIYQAACEGWDRYMQVVHGTRKPLDRSPSAGFVGPPSGRRERPYRQGSPGVSSRRDPTPTWSTRESTPGHDRAGPYRSRTGSLGMSRRSVSRQSEVSEAENYIEEFLAAHGINSMNELNGSDLVDLLTEWNL